MAMPSEGFDANQLIVIAIGDPAGIGMEVTLKALASPSLPSKLHPQLVGCRKSLELTYAQLQAQGISPLANPKNLDIKDLPPVSYTHLTLPTPPYV